MAVIYALLRVRLNNVQNVFVHQKSNHRRNRHYFSANGPFLLLPLALKWGLLSLLAMAIVPYLTARSASAASITLSIPSSLSLNVTPTAEGTFVESEPANLTISGADFGYNLSIKSQNKTNVLKGANSTLPSISKSYTVAQGNDGTWPVNTWGYKPSKKDGKVNNDYLPGPTTGDVIEKLQTAISTNNEHTIQIAARVDNSLPAGTYSNTFIFTVTANKATYTINYNANGGTGGPETQTGQTETANVPLSYDEPADPTKAFQGWCTTKPVDGNCSGTVYHPGDNYKLAADNSNVTLYAIWDEPEIMQNWKGCTEDLPIDRQITLKDIRDNKLYYVAKLADGNCWMTENLALGDAELINRTLSSDNTDLQIGTTFVLPESNFTAGFGYDETILEPFLYVTKGGEIQYLDYRSGYYTWAAATATSGTGTASDYSDFISGGNNAPNSICPNGWKLPSSDEAKNLLVTHYRSNKALVMDRPVNLLYSKAILRSQVEKRDDAGVGYDYGVLWSSTSDYSTKGEVPDAMTWGMLGGVGLTGGMDAVRGMPIRCMVRYAAV